MERLSRREILKRSAVFGLSSTAIGLLVAACGGATPATTAPSAAPSAAASTAPSAAASSAASSAAGGASTSAAASASASTGGASAAASGASGGGGKLIIGNNIDDIITFDPGVHYEITSQQILGAVYETLVWQQPADLTKFVPVLAKEVPTKENGGVSADGKTYTFKLRENVKFHSGNAMTADDVVFSMKRLHFLQKNPSFLADPFSTKDAVGVEAVDPLTVRFTLTEANVAFLSFLATTNTVVLDAKTVKANGGLDTADAADKDKAKDFLDKQSAGTGPYKLTSFKLKEEVVIEKHAGYWRQGGAFDQIVLKYIKDSGTALQQLQAGAIDIAQVLDADAIAGLRSNASFTIVEGNSLNHAYLALNTDPTVGDVVADKRVRQAIGYSVDYDGLIKGLKKGAAVQPATIVPIGLLSADKAQSLAYKTDVNKAKDLVTQAGAAGKTIKLTFGQGGNIEGIGADTLASKLKADIERSGLKVELVPQEPQQRLADYRAAKLQFTFSTWSPDYIDVHTYAEPFGASTGAAAKRVKYSNSQIDTLLKQGLVESDATKRADIYLQIQKILVDEAPFLMLYQPVFQVAMKKAITGYAIHPVTLVDIYALKRS